MKVPCVCLVVLHISGCSALESHRSESLGFIADSRFLRPTPPPFSVCPQQTRSIYFAVTLHLHESLSFALGYRSKWLPLLIASNSAIQTDRPDSCSTSCVLYVRTSYRVEGDFQQRARFRKRNAVRSSSRLEGL